jgi:hypothetical protein
MPVAYDAGEVTYDLDATEAGPSFSVHVRPGAGGFYYAYTGTWVGTTKLQQKSPAGTWLDMDGTSKTVNQGLTLIAFEGAAEFRFDFTRTSGTVTASAVSPSGVLDWTSAIRLEGMPGLALLETSKPIALE